MWEDIKKIKSGIKELREFGLTIGGVLVILGLMALWRSRPSYIYFITTGVALICLGLAMPKALKHLQKIWMAFSIIIGFFMSHLILIILFYLIITPIGLLAKILGNDILDLRISKDRKSYWIDRSVKVKTKASYENQF